MILLLINSNNDQELNKKIRELDDANKVLKKENSIIIQKVADQKARLNEYEKNLTKLRFQDEQHQEMIRQANKDLKKLKSKYEKVSTHSDNFTSEQIRRYFADSIR